MEGFDSRSACLREDIQGDRELYVKSFASPKLDLPETLTELARGK